MKIFLFIVSLPAVLLFAACDKGDPSTSEDNQLDAYYSSVPAYVSIPNKAVLDAFNKDFPGSTNTAWEISNNVYKASFTSISGVKSSNDDSDDDDRCEAWYSDDGRRLQSKDDIRTSDLPQAVKDAIIAKYPGYHIDDADIVRRGDDVFYEIEVEKGDDDIEFYINADGSFREESPSRGNNNGLKIAKNDFKTRFPGADDDDWDVFSSFIRVEFEWDDNDDDDDWIAIYNSDGTLRLTKQEIDDDNLPAAITNAIRSKYGKGCDFDDAWKVTEGNVVTYEVAIEDDDDKDLIVYYKTDGTFIKEVVRYDDDDDDHGDDDDDHDDNDDDHDDDDDDHDDDDDDDDNDD